MAAAGRGDASAGILELHKLLSSFRNLMISTKVGRCLDKLFLRVKSIQNRFLSSDAKNSRHQFIADIALSAGGIGRLKVLGYSLWCISDQALLRHLLFDPKSNLKKGNILSLIRRLIGHSLFTADSPEWDALSNSTKSSLGNINSQSYRNRVVEVVENWLENRKPEHKSSFVLSLRGDLYFLSMDIITSVLLGCLLPETSKAIIYSNHEWIQKTIKRRIGSSMIMPTWIPSPTFLKIYLTKQRINTLLSPWVTKARDMSNEYGHCLLSDVDTEIQGKSLCPFSATQHKDLVKTLFFTGIRTTAVTLEWIILYMASQPDKLHEIQNEIDTISEAGKLSLNNIPKLEYLERFITEVMRIAPIAHTHVRQVKAGFEYENCKFRAGDILLLSVFGFNHDPDIWKEPDEFYPERFANKALTSSLFPFGLGQHTCPGRYLAYQDILIVLVSLLQKFNIKAIAPINLDPCSSLLLEPSKEQVIELIAR